MKTIFAVIGVLAVLFVMAMFAVCDDSDDPNSMARIAYHERDRCYDYDCGDGGGYDDRGDRYGDGRGGYSGGPSGGYYEGGRGGSDYDGDGDGNRCRNFCVYPVQPPNEGGQR